MEMRKLKIAQIWKHTKPYKLFIKEKSKGSKPVAMEMQAYKFESYLACFDF